jgi:UPF0176 protein
MTSIVIATFYKFVDLSNFTELREPILQYCREYEVKGSILLADEGINATIAGPRADIDAVLAYLRANPKFADMTHKESFADFNPFPRMKVRLKKEIVHLGVPGVDPNKKVGTYIDAHDWNDLISDPDVILIDTRNDFEVQAGTFQGAINPETISFNNFPEYVQDNLDPNEHKKVAMFCTGGIRCEKATSYLLEQGFDEVFHLKDGILKYLEEIPEEESMWQGECFVFDQRVTVKHDLVIGEVEYCTHCQVILTDEAKASPYFRKGFHCPECYDSIPPERIARIEERHRQAALAEARALS